MWTEFFLYALAGFAAQLVDGAMGMAFGIISSSLLLGMGMAPAAVSATVHAVECFTCGASAVSHKIYGNIDRKLFIKLAIGGVPGAVVGAYILTSVPGETIKPVISIYLVLMGIIILIKAFREIAPQKALGHLKALGFGGALLDTMGGGGWGPVVTSTLVARGADIRKTIGSVNAVEFFVTFTASVTFFLTIGFGHLHIIAAMAAGGLLAAPLGAWLCRHIPVKPFMIAVGVLVIGLSIYNFYKSVS